MTRNTQGTQGMQGTQDVRSAQAVGARFGGAGVTLIVGGPFDRTGQRVAARLTAGGLPVRVGMRSGEPPFVWEDAATWEPALAGVDAVCISCHPGLAFLEAAQVIGEFSRCAVANGVRRLVLLSDRGDKEAGAAERAVQDSGADWTVMRAGWLYQEFSESFFLEPVLAGELPVPRANAAEPFVDADDVADVAVAVLTDDTHIGRVYELAGPRLLSFHEVAGELSKAVGREIRCVPVGLDAYCAVLEGNCLPAKLADRCVADVEGCGADPADGVQRVLGRAPRDFAAFARDVAATGVWSA